MKKTLASLLLVVAIACSLGVTAFAATPGMGNFKATASYTAKTFSDVPASQWYAAAVGQCYEYGLMGGKGAGRFDPAGSLTVGEAIAMADQVNAIYTTGQRATLTGTPWYQPYVDYAVNNGIIKTGDFTSYTATATRAQMAYIFAHALPGAEYSQLFAVNSVPDVKTTDKYASEIYTLYNAGILSGSDKYGNYHPAANIKRCEAAAIIRRVALSAQREPAVLFKDFTNGIVKFAMPVTSEQSQQDGYVQYLFDDIPALSANLGISTQTDAAYSGASITQAPVSELESEIVDGFTQQGITATVTSSKAVKFGTISAYRITVSYAMDGNQFAENCYCFISGSTMYILAAAAADTNILKTIDSSITVNGSAAK